MKRRIAFFAPTVLVTFLVFACQQTVDEPITTTTPATRPVPAIGTLEIKTHVDGLQIVNRMLLLKLEEKGEETPYMTVEGVEQQTHTTISVPGGTYKLVAASVSGQRTEEPMRCKRTNGAYVDCDMLQTDPATIQVIAGCITQVTPLIVSLDSHP